MFKSFNNLSIGVKFLSCCLITAVAFAVFSWRSIGATEHCHHACTLLWQGAFETKSFAEGGLTQVITVNSKDEIGNLARYFNDTMDKIKSMIIIIKKQAASLHTIVTDLTSNMNQTATSINQITANIQIIKEQVLNQSAGVTETHATMEQVVTNIDKLNSHVENQSHHVAQASSAIEQNEMLEGAREVITESNNLEKVTAQITSGMNEMASGAEQINAAVNHVSELCGKTREGIDILMAEVSRFKVA